MPSIENEFLKVSVDLKGALLTSVIDKKTGEELLWQKDPKYWPNQDVVIFPTIGVPAFEHHGKAYDPKTRHGFARTSLFEVIEQEPTAVTMLLRSNEESLAIYPFAFALEASLRLEGTTIKRKVVVKNYGKEPLPFALGFHQAFKQKFDGSGSIHFSKAPAEYYPLRDGLLMPKEKSIYKQDEVLSKDLWKVNETWCLPNDHYLIGVDTGFGYQLHYHFDAPEIAIWSKGDGGDFLCVEPWWGIGAYQGMPKEISERFEENNVEKEATFALDIEILKA